MTHLPLTLGEYRTAGGIATVVYIGKHDKWAFGTHGFDKWHVATGEHVRDPDLDIIARRDRDAELANVITVPLMSWTAANLDHLRQEVGKLHSQLDRVRAELDEAVAALAFYADASRYKIECQLSPLSFRTARLNTTFPPDGVFKDEGRTARAFLAKIGG